jgi:phosphotriesterase-related protein
MDVMTVTGPLPVEQLGVILPHEHILMAFDWPGLWPDVSHRPDLVWQKVSLENLGELRRNYCAIRDNAVLDSVDEQAWEVSRFKQFGGGAILEMSTYGLYGNPSGLREISRKSGVPIIAGTGYYLDQTFPQIVKDLTVEQMAAKMLRDITDGFEGTGESGDSPVRAGIIGEVGISWPMSPAEEKSLRAAARVQRETGLAINIHVGFSIDLSRQAIQILKEEGADFKKVAFAHCDGNSLEVNGDLTEWGYVECDCFGNEFYVDNGAYDGDTPWYFGSDGDRIRAMKALIDAGLADKLLFSQDVSSKMQTVQYGGYGYAHLLENILPMVEHIGVPKEILMKIITQNPKRFLLGE